MKKGKQWLEHWLGTEKGLATASELYERWFAALGRRSARVLGVLAAGASPSPGFFVRLLHVGPGELKTLSGCGKCAVLTAYHHLLDFRSRLMEAFFEDLAASYSHVLEPEDGRWVPRHELQYLKADIDRMTSGLSMRSQNVVRALFLRNKQNVGLLYRSLSDKDFDCRALRGVGPVIYPEIRRWCEGVISLVRNCPAARFPYRLLR